MSTDITTLLKQLKPLNLKLNPKGNEGPADWLKRIGCVPLGDIRPFRTTHAETIGVQLDIFAHLPHPALITKLGGGYLRTIDPLVPATVACWIGDPVIFYSDVFLCPLNTAKDVIEAWNPLNDFVRNRLREESFFSRIMPPLAIPDGPMQLTREGLAQGMMLMKEHTVQPVPTVFNKHQLYDVALWSLDERPKKLLDQTG